MDTEVSVITSEARGMAAWKAGLEPWRRYPAVSNLKRVPSSRRTVATMEPTAGTTIMRFRYILYCTTGA